MTPTQASLCRGGEVSQEGAGIPSLDFPGLAKHVMHEQYLTEAAGTWGRHTGDERLAVLM